MCLYTDQEVPEDLTGVVAYKRYKIIDGSLVTPFMGYYVNKMTQMAGPQEQKIPSIRKRIEEGYVHAYLSKMLGIYSVEADAPSILIKGRFIGLGYRSTFINNYISNDTNVTACAEGFELEEIVHERGDE